VTEVDGERGAAGPRVGGSHNVTASSGSPRDSDPRAAASGKISFLRPVTCFLRKFGEFSVFVAIAVWGLGFRRRLIVGFRSTN
jgi:hypothetical protein